MERRLVILIWVFAILAAPLCASETPKAVWTTHGMLINDTPGNTPQENPRVISDKSGNHIIVWEDGRSGYYDIYVQKVSGSGALLWSPGGVPVCRFAGNQNSARIASDGFGGAIIVWQDYRNGNADIYAQRINSAGQAMWKTGGRAVCLAPAGQFAPDIIPDGSGGAFIVWHDYRSAKGEDVYSQRIDPQGNSYWKENGVPVSTAKGTQWYPKIESDGSKGAIIVWTDGRVSSSDNNIYAQRISPSGKTLWEENGKTICSAPHNQERPTVLFSGDGVIVAWNDFRAGNSDIYTQKVDTNGNPRWTEEGVAACAASFAQENPKLASDGAGGVILAWTDGRSEPSDIYAQRIYRDGRAAWQTNGRPICKTDGKQKNPRIASLINDEWAITWEDNRRGTTDLFAQKINSAGTPLWQKNGMLIAAARHSQDSAVLSPTSSGSILVVWQDKRFGNYDIYAQKISSSGKGLFKKAGIVICATKGSVVQQKVELINDGKGGVILVFEDARSGFFNIYAQRINKYGQLAWGRNGVSIAKVAANQSNPCLVPDGKGGAIVAWEDHRIPNVPSVRVQRINAIGKKVWKSSLSVAAIKSRQTHPMMISDGKHGAIIAWQDDRTELDLQNIYAQRVSPKGKLLWGKIAKPVIAEAGDQTDIDMISDGSGGAFLAWTDYRRGDRNPDIYAQMINPKGKSIWREGGVQICGAPDVQRAPRLVRDGEGGILIAWTDKGGGSYDIYALRLSKSGKPIWITDGIPIIQLSRTQQNPKFSGSNILVWEDYRFGNWDIFAGTVDPSGKLLWGEKGHSVAQLPRTQYAPQVIQWNKTSNIIAWEDYRSGEYYEIFVQKLRQDGNPAWPHNGIKIQSRDGGRAPKIVANHSDRNFYIFWEDYTGGGRAIYGQKFKVN